MLQVENNNNFQSIEIINLLFVSHPLHGFTPNEVDDDEAIASGAVLGVKNAAIRKLEHELGIVGMNVSDFKYLTRLHYWAADVVTYGKDAPWGEHEIDYILFAKKNVKVIPNAEEVQFTWLMPLLSAAILYYKNRR